MVEKRKDALGHCITAVPHHHHHPRRMIQPSVCVQECPFSLESLQLKRIESGSLLAICSMCLRMSFLVMIPSKRLKREGEKGFLFLINTNHRAVKSHKSNRQFLNRWSSLAYAWERLCLHKSSRPHVQSVRVCFQSSCFFYIMSFPFIVLDRLEGWITGIRERPTATLIRSTSGPD